MKKIAKLLLIGCVCMSLAACGTQQPASDEVAQNETTTDVANTDAATADDATTEEVATEEVVTEADTSQSETESDDSQAETTESTTLVVYFSCTGNTEAIAESIAEGLGADLFEIVPEEPYSDADLDYGDNNSRSTLEMNDPSVRPAFVGAVEQMEQYDTVYIGYPIWWGEAPRIVATFVESYDFTDKTVIPFATSASSGMGSSGSGLEALAGSGNWQEGRRFSEHESADNVMEWVNGL